MVQNLRLRFTQAAAHPGLGAWLIQAAAYLGRESVRINGLQRCPRLAEAVSDCCACACFVIAARTSVG